MLGRVGVIAVSALTVVAGGCSDKPSGASQAAAGLLAAVHSGDQGAFEARIDRAALREDLRGQLLAVARNNGVEVDGGPSNSALDRMIAPQAFRLVAADTGAALADAPSAAQIEPVMKMQDKRRACLAPLGDRCLLTFARREDGWRLVGMQATDLRIPIGPAPEAD